MNVLSSKRSVVKSPPVVTSPEIISALISIYLQGKMNIDEILYLYNSITSHTSNIKNACIKLVNSDSKVLVIDSGSDTHLTNNKDIFLSDSIKKCDIYVSGINGNSDRNKVFHATVSGSVRLNLSSSMNVIIHKVLYVPDAVLVGFSDRTVLVSVKMLAREKGISTKFDENDVSFYKDDVLICTSPTIDSNMYLLRNTPSTTTNVIASESEKTEKKKVKDETSDESDVKQRKKKVKLVKESEKERVSDRTRNTITRRSILTKADRRRRKLARLLHGRIHTGKTSKVYSFLKEAYGDDLVLEWLNDEPCDACMWSKGRFKPTPKYSHRKAKRVGERLHYDVFTSSVRSEDGAKYLLVVIDEYSGYIWAYGMKRKSETSELVRMTVKTVEKHLRKRIEVLGGSTEKEVTGVSTLRSDNAKENITNKMRAWCASRGTRIETTIPYTPYQDGKAERLGGVVWQGGACLRYGGNLPKTDWLHCCLAYVYVRNRLPSNACLSTAYKTPYECYNDVSVSPKELVDTFKTIGCLCYVLLPHSLRSGKSKKAYRALLLGYSDNVSGQKGYIVRNLSTGDISSVAHNQIHCYESKLAFQPARTYDAWLNKQIDTVADEKIRDSTSKKGYDSSGDDNDEGFDSSSRDSESSSRDGESSSSEEIEILSDDSESDNDSDDMIESYLTCNDNDNDSDNSNEPNNDARVSPATPNRASRVRRRGSSVDEMTAAEVKGIPSLSPTIHNPKESMIDHESDSDDIEVVEESDDDSQSDTSDEIERGEWEVVAIKQSRKRGRGVQYQTEWKNGELTWEPSSTFQVDKGTTSTSYLPIYTLFNENKEKGIVGARASDCEMSDSEDEEEKYGTSEVERRGSDSTSVVAGAGAAAAAKAKEKPKAASADAEGAGSEIDSAEESGEVGENENTSHSSSTDPSATVTIEHITLAIRTVLALVALEKAGIVIPQSRKEARIGKYWKQFSEAEDEEMKSFSELDVWELVEKPKGANVVGTKWVYDVKINPDGSINRYKARLVAQGFSQKEGIDFTETFAPTMHIKTLRLLLTIAARHNIVARVYDISTAFLHASLDEEVYVQQPKGHIVKGKEKCVYRLKKAMYGLKNAPKAFSDHFMNILSETGFKQSTKDSCLWYLRRGTHFVYYLFHVDDILVVSNHDTLRNACFNMLEKKLRIRDEGEVKKFLSIEIERRSDGSYSMSQSKYIERLAKRFCIDDMSRTVETPGQYGQKLQPVSDNEMPSDARQLPYQELVGGLLYACKTRPDIAYAISNVSRFMSKWSVSHYKAALRILRYLYSTKDKALVISADAPMELKVYVDANYGDDRESENSDSKWKSQGGFLVYFSSSLVSWRSRRHKTRSLSSMESEYMEASEAAKEVLFFRVMLEELDYKQSSPTIMYEDNKACIQYSKNNTSHDRTKHIDIRAYVLRDCVRNNDIKLMHVDTRDQLADMLTKHQLKHVFLNHVNSLFSGFSVPATARVVNRVNTCHCLTCFVVS